MVTERQQSHEFLEKLALFYYFSFLDEGRAQAATNQTLKKISQDRSEYKDAGSDVELVRVTDYFLKKTKKKIKPVGLAFSSGSILLPEKSNWGPWFEFRKEADVRDFHAILYSRILEIKEEDIAEGLSLPIGTIHYRMGRGLKTLGQILRQSEPHK
jgi:hypothetical protein